MLTKLTDEPGAGVRQVSGREVSEEVDSPPEWLDLLADHRLLGPDELPPGFASGWRYTAPAVHMPAYLEYLLRRYQGLGGSVSAEHGIGALKAPWFPLVRSAAERELFARIRSARISATTSPLVRPANGTPIKICSCPEYRCNSA